MAARKISSVICFSRTIRSAIATALLMLSWATFSSNSLANGITENKTFDIKSDVHFQNYEDLVEKYVSKHQPNASSDLCIVGIVAGDNSKLAWILWPKGKQFILWEGQETDLNLSRRKIDLTKDVVKSEQDLHGSTYLVTKAWVDDISATCDRAGTKLRVEKRKKAKKQ